MTSAPVCRAELSRVSKRFGTIQALDGLDLAVGSGELVAVLGPNGAGKSTAIAILLGLQRPDTGTARLFGRSPHDLAARRRIGVMMQDVALAPELSVREHVALIASYYPDPPPVDDTLRAANVTAIAARRYRKLSGGQKRQAQFAMAVAGRPSLLFLDEPSVGLDVEAREAMWTVLRRLVSEGCSVVLTTHYLEEAERLADRVVVLSEGRVLTSGTVAQIRSVVDRKRITCTTLVSAHDVADWPGVVAASNDRGRLHVTTADAEGIVRRLLAADMGLGELEVRRAGLAEAFAELTQRVVS
jgi:ABC-2 type transport system ATP-binding protein